MLQRKSPCLFSSPRCSTAIHAWVPPRSSTQAPPSSDPLPLTKHGVAKLKDGPAHKAPPLRPPSLAESEVSPCARDAEPEVGVAERERRREGRAIGDRVVARVQSKEGNRDTRGLAVMTEAHRIIVLIETGKAEEG